MVGWDPNNESATVLIYNDTLRWAALMGLVCADPCYWCFVLNLKDPASSSLCVSRITLRHPGLADSIARLGSGD